MPTAYNPDDYDLPKDPYETCETDDEDVIRRTRARAVKHGGRMIPGDHEDRYTTFEILTHGINTHKQLELTSCGHPAAFVIPPESGGRMVTACVVCDCADRWPRLEDV